MAIYLYPNVPKVFNAADQIIIPFINKVQELDLYSLNIGKCKIECFSSRHAVNEGGGVNYTAGTIDLTDLIKKGISKLYAVVPACCNMNYGNQNSSQVYIMQNYVSYTEYERFGGASRVRVSSGATWGDPSATGSGGSTDLRTYYDASKGIYDTQSQQSVIIAAGGEGTVKGVPSSIAGESGIDNAPNNIVTFSERLIKKNCSVPTFCQNGYIIITALSGSYIPSDYVVEIKTPAGVSKFPLYKINVDSAASGFQVKAQNGDVVYGVSTLVSSAKDNVSLKNPDLNYLIDEAGATGTGSGSGTTTSSNEGSFKFYIGDIFMVPDSVSGLEAQPYYHRDFNVNAVTRTYTPFYFSVVPGQPLGGRLHIHYTYYSFDASYYFSCNNNGINNMGRIPPERGWDHGGGTAAPSYDIFRYNKDISNKCDQIFYGFSYPFAFFNGDKTIFADGKTSYTLSAKDGYVVWVSNRACRVRVSVPSTGYKYEITFDSSTYRVARYYVKGRKEVFVSIYDPFRHWWVQPTFTQPGDADVKVDIIG